MAKVTNIQYCIDSISFKEVMDMIPKTVEISDMWWEIGHTFGKTRYNVPSKLQKLGVKYISMPSAGRRYNGRFTNIARTKMVDNIKAVCAEAGVGFDKARIDKMKLEYDGVEAIFKYNTKEIRPDNTDQRKKLKVLGVTDITGGGLSKLLAQLSLNKYSCKIEEVTTKRVICKKT